MLARWSRNRVLVVLVPVHIVAFIALYLGTMSTVRREILATHIADAKILAQEAIGGLSPYMASHMPHPASPALSEWSDAHHLLGLEIYGRDGASIAGAEFPDADMRRFLDGTGDDRFDVVNDSGATVLTGLIRVRATERCASCHTVGDILGAATMRMDLSEPVAAAERRVRRNLLMLIAGWGLIVGFVNMTLGGWARRSLSRLNGEWTATDPSTPEGNLSRVPQFPVDAVSAEIYSSLRQLLKRKAFQQREVDERLHHQQRLASLGQLAAGLAHEIKNPLSGIHGVLELLRDDAPDREQHDLYERMLSELDRVNGTIHSLLSFARPTTLTKVPTDIGALLESSVQLQRASLAAKGISIRVIVAPQLPEVPVDQNLLRQALVNLVSNSAEAIERDGAITLTAAALPEFNGVVISVTDDGPGIARGHRDHVTDPFFTTKFTGTGLGLAIVRNIVAAHDGALEIDSTVGRGTSVFIILPTNGAALGAAAGA